MRYQTYAKGESTVLIGLLPSGETVSLSLYSLLTLSPVVLTSFSCVEIGNTGLFTWFTGNIETQPTTLTPYVYVMTAGTSGEKAYGKFVLGGYVDAINDTRLAELDAANIPADIDTLIARLTAVRAGYLDNLSAGAVALESTAQIIQALCGKNNKLYNPAYDDYGNLTAATIKGYASKADLEADQNPIFTLTLENTYSGFGKITTGIRKDST